MYISGEKDYSNYTTKLEGGSLYYLHLGYYKNSSLRKGDDTFTINNISISLNEDDYYYQEFTTNEHGEIRTLVPTGKYIVEEVVAPEGYELNSTRQTIEVGANTNNVVTIEDEVLKKITVHHYLKGTTNSVAEDEVYYGATGEQYITSPYMDLNKLSLIKDNNGIYQIPSNASGTYKDKEEEVIYYYEPDKIRLTIHHYLEGTEDKLAEDDIIETTSRVIFDVNGKYIVESNENYILIDNENYNNLISTYNLSNIDSRLKDDIVISDTLKYNEDSEVTYYYSKKQYNISTEVLTHTENRTNELSNEKEEITVEGGTISGEEYTVYETVEEGAKTKKKIVITPDTTYKVSKVILITKDQNGNNIKEEVIYGEGIVENPEIKYTEENGVVTLTQLENVTANKHIVVEFESIPGSVVIHHYFKNTGVEYRVDPVYIEDIEGNIIQDEIKQDYIGELYIAKASENVHTKYHLVSVSGNEQGKYIDGVINIYYYYEYNDYSYRIEHYYQDKITREYVKDDEATENKEAIKYGSTVEVKEEDRKVKPGYEYERQVNSPLTITENEETNVIKLHYGLADYEYKIEHYYESPITEDYVKDESLTDKKSAEFGDIIEITDNMKKEKTGYQYEKSENAPLTVSEVIENNVIKLYYNAKEYNYTVNYFYNNIQDETLTESNNKAKYGEIITEYEDKCKEGFIFNKVEPSKEGKCNLEISNIEDNNIINVYYLSEFTITTDVIEHTETYKDGTVKEKVKGGSISGEDEEPYEKIIIWNDNTKDIIITPDEGYEIVKITINGEKLDLEEDDFVEDGSVTLDKFTEMTESKNIEVEFRKKTKIIVKYLEKETEEILAEGYEEEGYEDKDYTTSRVVIQNYQATEIGITDENQVPIESDGKMTADEKTIIYWYERKPNGIYERHIETNEKGEEIELETNSIKGLAGLTTKTNRKEFNRYFAVDGIKHDELENVYIMNKDDNTKEVTYLEDKVVEVWYYYERDFNISTAVKLHKEGNNYVAGGTISKESNSDIYETVLSRADSTKSIVMVPEEGYRIKEITIQENLPPGTIKEEKVYVDSLIVENKQATIPAGYFKDVQADYKVIVEYEKIPAEVIVHYQDVHTHEQIHVDTIINGFVNDNYNTTRLDIENYVPTGFDPENANGKMTEDIIEVLYEYTKQFRITTFVKPHKESETNGEEIYVKGGTISGEGDIPYERVERGNNSTKEIKMVPEDGYRIVEVYINSTKVDIEKYIKEDGSLEFFESVRDELNCNAIKIAIYSDDKAGYSKELHSLMSDGIDYATELGLYVIIDWAILDDNNPNENKDKAIEFFEEMASEFKNYDNIIYEICNEPNGNVTWEDDIKPYAEELIPKIRAIDEDGIIVVGTPNFSQDVDVVALDKLEGYSNVVYAFHFYSATHKDDFRQKLQYALDVDMPILVTEFGTCEADGDGIVDLEEADKWIKYLRDNNIGYLCWNLTNKEESSSLLKSTTEKVSGWGDEDLSDSGLWLKRKYTEISK